MLVRDDVAVGVVDESGALRLSFARCPKGADVRCETVISTTPLWVRS
jgi:hypothetical protein